MDSVSICIMGIGDWGLAQSPIPNPHPQPFVNFFKNSILISLSKNIIFIIFNFNE